MPQPKDTKLYAKVKADADKKFLAPTSAYKSAWIVAEYKKRGGIYMDDHKKKGLTQWFKEKWVDLERPLPSKQGYAECGRHDATARGVYPLCRPSKRVNKSTPKTVNEIDTKKLQRIHAEKQKVKYKGRITFS
jgi:hypothetical protein